MALNIVTAQEPMRVENLIVFIYGDPGIGKTSLAFSTKNPILFDFDKGAHRAGKYRKDTVQVTKWTDVSALTADDLKDYDTVIVDTAGRMLDVIIAHLVKDQKNCRRNSNELSIQGYGTLNKTFTHWFNLLRSFGKDVVLLAHTAEDKKGDDIIFRPDMVGASKKEAYKVADMMGYMTTVQGAQGTQKAINFSPNIAFHAKDSGAIGNLILNDLDTQPDQLDSILNQAKSHINNLSESQAEAQKELDNWQSEVLASELIEDFEQLKAKLPKNHVFVRQMWNEVLQQARQYGFDFNKESNSFVSVQPREQTA
ncbi:ATP-binding protein [Acinetobacter ursingii]|uniref:ATP-binding protein n=1 Tax=Acinetobacter ursingii TaxID=108980 RepID=UPI00029AB557|nr:ATP-binding protein [Acinetobacter ursingii]ENV76236.1 hypothetical protein F944_01707 [Acinetobacter ursingii DSM 16037 = CIP 107286]QQT67256.1 ATP-binding protein [Acinetobacter ursingii]